MALPPAALLLTGTFVLALAATLFLAATLRILALLPVNKQPPQKRKVGTPTRILIVLGSGGHTHEMLHLLKDLKTWKYTHRTYVVSSGDAFSAARAAEFEQDLEKQEIEQGRVVYQAQEDDNNNNNNNNKKKKGEADGQGRGMGKSFTGPSHYDIAFVPRARLIHQSLLTTPLSALRCLWSCFPILLSSTSSLGSAPASRKLDPYERAAHDLPDLILTNGPATAVIFILASLVLRFFNVRGANSRGKMRTIYVESFARVKSVSLSGKLLVRVVDRFLVQWEGLKGYGGRAEFHGILV